MTKTHYYPKAKVFTNSFKSALESINIDSSFANRRKIASVNGVSVFMNLPAQNEQLNTLLRIGKLKRP